MQLFRVSHFFSHSLVSQALIMIRPAMSFLLFPLYLLCTLCILPVCISGFLHSSLPVSTLFQICCRALPLCNASSVRSFQFHATIKSFSSTPYSVRFSMQFSQSSLDRSNYLWAICLLPSPISFSILILHSLISSASASIHACLQCFAVTHSAVSS